MTIRREFWPGYATSATAATRSSSSTSLTRPRLDFPFRSTTLFKGLEGMPDILAEPAALRRAYQTEIQGFCAQLRKGCQGANIDYVQLRTDQTLDTALSSYLASRSMRVK